MKKTALGCLTFVVLLFVVAVIGSSLEGRGKREAVVRQRNADSMTVVTLLDSKDGSVERTLAIDSLTHFNRFPLGHAPKSANHADAVNARLKLAAAHLKAGSSERLKLARSQLRTVYRPLTQSQGAILNDLAGRLKSQEKADSARVAAQAKEAREVEMVTVRRELKKRDAREAAQRRDYAAALRNHYLNEQGQNIRVSTTGKDATILRLQHSLIGPSWIQGFFMEGGKELIDGLWDIGFLRVQFENGRGQVFTEYVFPLWMAAN